MCLGTVFFVHLLNLPDVGTILENIVVKFKECANCSFLGTGKLAKRVKVEVVDAATQDYKSNEPGDDSPHYVVKISDIIMTNGTKKPSL